MIPKHVRCTSQSSCNSHYHPELLNPMHQSSFFKFPPFIALFSLYWFSLLDFHRHSRDYHPMLSSYQLSASHVFQIASCAHSSPHRSYTSPCSSLLQCVQKNPCPFFMQNLLVSAHLSLTPYQHLPITSVPSIYMCVEVSFIQHSSPWEHSLPLLKRGTTVNSDSQ